MTVIAPIRSLALAAATPLATCGANAVALTRGVVSLAGGFGSCNESQMTPLDTRQDGGSDGRDFISAHSRANSGTARSLSTWSSRSPT